MAEDLKGRIFGFLKVLERAEDRITPSGQKRIFWNCECLLCGSKKDVGAQQLKRGSTISCGCWQAVKGKQMRNTKICVVCGKEFESPPSGNITCSKECWRMYESNQRMGRRHTEQTKKKISMKAKGRDMSGIQKIGMEAAKASPNSGRYITNVNAIDWHLVSPEGRHYRFRSLRNWLRENGKELFGCEPDSRGFYNVCSGLTGAKRAMLGGTYPCCTYKGWQVIPTDGDYQNKDGSCKDSGSKNKSE